MAGKFSSNADGEITLGVLRAIEDNPELTQRGLADDLGIALGLVNTYLKRCVNTGLVKIRQVPRNRYAYYLTPTGFTEKARLTAEFFSQSLSLFRQAQAGYVELFEQCDRKGWSRVALAGVSDLTEIAILYAREHQVEVVCVLGDEPGRTEFHGCPVVDSLDAQPQIDAVIVTGLRNSQSLAEKLLLTYPAERVLVPDFLEVRVPTTVERTATE